MPAKDLFHFELYRDEFGQHRSVQKAMNEVRNNCWVKFQFGYESDESGWFDGEMARNWFQHKSDLVPNKTAWDNLRKFYFTFTEYDQSEKFAKLS